MPRRSQTIIKIFFHDFCDSLLLANLPHPLHPKCYLLSVITCAQLNGY
uniref:Uncharacterized protein n=1 Tax=Arundo donax TaxID=35708 RepID=A0A0A8ZS12_ARUDO